MTESARAARPSRVYETRFDNFRAKEGLRVYLWAREAGMKRTMLTKFRIGEGNPRSTTVIRLVAAAERLLGRAVRASELFDFGEDEPVGAEQVFRRPALSSRGRLVHSRLGMTLRRIGISSRELSKISGVTKTSIRRICLDSAAPRNSVVRLIVISLRRAGYAVRPGDITDVGDDNAYRMAQNGSNSYMAAVSPLST